MPYKTISNFFNNHFKEADICILSSHLNFDDIKEMVFELHRRCYNVAGIFWSNSEKGIEDISSKINWDERLWFNNQRSNKWEQQIDMLALNFSDFILKRSLINN